ncbi:MFS transporter [Actinomadura sp. KC216]|nr:MFS transporter [Actinomadura sp. KC216]
MVDTVIAGPLIVLSDMLDHFGTDEAAWLNASAMLAGAMWAPLLGKAADIHGKRKILGGTLLAACAGALVCLFAPNIWVFIFGRLLQGAAVASFFLAVALIRDICEPRIGMTVVGIVTSGSAVLGIVTPVMFVLMADAYGFRSVFVLSAAVAFAMAICVRTLLPESQMKTPSRLDVTGAVLLGGGLAMVLSYVSLGPDFGWFAFGPLALLAVGTGVLATWFRQSGRIPEPLVNVRKLGRPLVVTLLVVVLGTGSYQSMLQLVGIIRDVSLDQGLGYGIAEQGPIALLFAAPSLGIMIGGPLAGALAARISPASTLAAGAGLGLVGTLGMFFGISQLYVAVVFAFVLGLTAGALVTSGFNMAGSLAPAERQGSVSSLVMVMIAIGSVAMNFVGSAVLKSTNVVVGGSTENSATGVVSYIAVGLGAFLAAAVLAVILVRMRRVVDAPASTPSSVRAARSG